MKQTEKRLYILGWAAIFIGLIMIVMMNVLEFDFLELVPPCGFRFMTGFYCPGCGGTRAVRALLQGKVLASFLYHPFVLYCATIAGVFMMTNTLQLLSRNRWNIGLKYRHGYLYGGVAVIIVNWVLQNIYIYINR